MKENYRRGKESEQERKKAKRETREKERGGDCPRFDSLKHGFNSQGWDKLKQEAAFLPGLPGTIAGS